MTSVSPPAPATTADVRPQVCARGETLVLFLATLGPMLTVPALRKLVVEGHHGTPATVHLFVALGMFGSAIGAPLVAAYADRRGSHTRIAIALALVDALIGAMTASAIPTSLLFALRPIHGLASMGILALLFAEFRRSRSELVAYAGGAMVAALAIGPALGGAMTRLGPATPFRAAAVVALLVAAILTTRRGSRDDATTRAARTAARPSCLILGTLASPLLVVATQRFAIGGFVTAFAVQARAVHGLTDARVGASFSLLLVVFAAAVFTLGRARSGPRLASYLPAGGLLFAASFAALAFAPALVLPLALAGAGLGAGLVYAPCLDLVSAACPVGGRATSMALLHSAGAVGMILGPITGAVFEFALRGVAAPQRCALFIAGAGALHAVVALVLSPRCRALATASLPTT